MHFRTFGNALVIAALCCATVDATAQAGAEGPAQCVRLSRLDNNVRCDEAPTGETIIIEHELMDTTIRLDGVTVQTRKCQGKVSLSYVQNNTLASIEGEIDNTTCGASSGNLVLSVSTSNESGELTRQEFTQSWMREDDQPVAFSVEYPIGENTDLVRVRALRIGCTCAEAPQADAAEPLPE